MKRTAVSIFLFILAFGWLGAATIMVTKPAADEIWVKGQPCQVVWTKSGIMPNLVRISLRDKTGATQVKLLADNQPNSGSYSGTVPQDVADGQYVVRVKVKNATVSDDSDVFIIAASAGPSIHVTKPTTGDKWKRNTSYAVTWTKTGTMPNSVKIDLMNKNGTTVVEPIADNQPNNGSYHWPVPADTPLGESRVRVQVKTTSIEDIGEVFSVVTALTPVQKEQATAMLGPYLNVVNPVENAVVRNGDHLSIKFATNTSGTVEIGLYNGTMDHKIIDIDQQAAFGQGQEIPPVGPGFPNQYVYDWEVPYGDTFSPGDYTIRIRGYESGRIGWSKKFRITWPMKEHEYTFEGVQSASIFNDLALNDHNCLNPWPSSPSCQPNSKNANVGWYVFDYKGECTGGSPYWRYWVYYSQLKFPVEQFMGKNTALLKARLRIQKLCTVNLNTTQASAAQRLYRLKQAPPPTPHTLAQWQSLQKEALYILPNDLTEESYDVEWTVRDWILQNQPHHGFLLAVANENPMAKPSTCFSAYRVSLYIKIQEEFKGYD